jgi:uncharacterized membrane protein YqjE
MEEPVEQAAGAGARAASGGPYRGQNGDEGERPAASAAAASGTAHEPDDDPHPARALTLHLLRMFETRMDAAGIVIQSEMQSFTRRLQLKLLVGAAAFFAVWAGIVLLAIALPEDARIPVLGGVVALFVVAAVWAHLASKRKVSAHQVGSMHWFLESLKLDLDVLSRSLNRVKGAAKGQPVDRSAPHDLTH